MLDQCPWQSVHWLDFLGHFADVFLASLLVSFHTTSGRATGQECLRGVGGAMLHLCRAGTAKCRVAVEEQPEGPVCWNHRGLQEIHQGDLQAFCSALHSLKNAHDWQADEKWFASLYGAVLHKPCSSSISKCLQLSALHIGATLIAPEGHQPWLAYIQPSSANRKCKPDNLCTQWVSSFVSSNT